MYCINIPRVCLELDPLKNYSDLAQNLVELESDEPNSGS